MAIKMTVKITSTTEIDIEVPAFRKFGKNLFYKVIDSENAIRVSPEDLGTFPASSALDRTEECSEEEFEQAFDKFLSNYKLTRL